MTTFIAALIVLIPLSLLIAWLWSAACNTEEAIVEKAPVLAPVVAPPNGCLAVLAIPVVIFFGYKLLPYIPEDFSSGTFGGGDPRYASEGNAGEDTENKIIGGYHNGEYKDPWPPQPRTYNRPATWTVCPKCKERSLFEPVLCPNVCRNSKGARIWTVYDTKRS